MRSVVAVLLLLFAVGAPIASDHAFAGQPTTMRSIQASRAPSLFVTGPIRLAQRCPTNPTCGTWSAPRGCHYRACNFRQVEGGCHVFGCCLQCPRR